MSKNVFMSPLFFMVLAVVLYGVYPTAITFVNSSGIEPGSFLLFVHILGLTTVLLTLYFSSINLSSLLLVCKIVAKDKTSKLLLLGAMACNTASNILIYVALGGENKIQSAVIYETWPLLFILLTLRFRKADEGGLVRLHSVPITICLLLLGLLGLILVSTSGAVFSEVFSVNSFSSISSTLYTAMAAAVVMAGSGYFGTSLNRHLSKLIEIDSEDSESTKARLKSVLSTAVLSRVVSVIISVFYVIGLQENIATNFMRVESALVPMLFSGFVVGIGGVLFHYANVKSNSSNINFLWYFVPAIGAFSFLIFGLEDDLHNQVLVGTILIIISNFGLNLRVDYSSGFISALIALSVTSFICLKFPAYPVEKYYEALGVVASIFAILVAFYTDRQFQRFNIRKDLFLELYNLSEHYKDDQLKKYALSNDVELTHVQFRTVYERYRSDLNVSEKILKYFQEMKQSIPFADIFIIWLLGISTILLSILTRNPDEYLSQFVPVVMSVSIVFLCVSTSQDLRVRYGGRFLYSDSEALEQEFETSVNQDLKLTSVLISVFVLIALLGLQFTAALLSR